MKIIKDLSQGTLLWKKARLGVITGTRLGRATGSPKVQRTLICELIAETETEQAKESGSSKQTDRGNAEEEFAIKKYEEVTGEKTEEVGFCVHSKYDWIGLSPDRFIKKKGKFVKGVEAKCPNSDTMISYRMNNIKKQKIPSIYYKQCLHYFNVNEDMMELDFIVYDERFINDKMKIFIITIKRKDIKKELEESMKQLLEFKKTWDNYKTQLINNNF